MGDADGKRVGGEPAGNRAALHRDCGTDYTTTCIFQNSEMYTTFY